MRRFSIRISRIVISLNDRQLSLMLGPDTLYNAACRVSTDSTLEYSGQDVALRNTARRTQRAANTRTRYGFLPTGTTPRSRVITRSRSAAMTRRRTMLSDGNWLEVRNDTVGVVDATSREFATLPTNEEIVFDGTLSFHP